MVIPQKSRGDKLYFWDIVLNNYTEEECESVKSIFENICEAYVVGKEIGSENNTPHLQCAIKLKKNNYKSYLLNIFKKSIIGNRASIRKGRNINAMREYCMKDNIWISKNIEKIELKKKLNGKNLLHHYKNHISRDGLEDVCDFCKQELYEEWMIKENEKDFEKEPLKDWELKILNDS